MNPVWEIEMSLNGMTVRVLTTEPQGRYDEYDNWQEDEPVGSLII